MPGLWDAHVHLMSSAGTNIRSSAHINEHLKALLYEGVTSIIDLGSPPQTLFSLRERIERGEVLGPHLRTAGPFFTTPGGHPCPVDYDPETCALITTPESAETAMAALRSLPPLRSHLHAGGSLSVSAGVRLHPWLRNHQPGFLCPQRSVQPAGTGLPLPRDLPNDLCPLGA